MQNTRTVLSVIRASAIAASISGGILLGSASVAQSSGIIQRDDPRFVALDDFLHFILIDRPDVAEAKARELLGMNIDPREFVLVVEELETQRRGRDFLEVTRRGERRPQLEAVAGELINLYDRGRLAQARNADEIARNIGMLTGTLQARVIARERLLAAGEYAMPQLLEALLQRRDARLRAAAQQLVIDMRRQAVIPLSVAMQGVEGPDQERLAAILGQIPYPSSIPFLKQVAEETQDDGIRQAATNSIAALGGTSGDAARAYVELGDRYYAESEDLTSFAGEEFQLLWAYEPSVGLTPIPIATEVFHEAMTMSLVERALKLEETSPAALALWVAANFSREIDETPGYANPAYGSDRREALYYAVAAGSEVGSEVLGRAIRTSDTALALRALASLARTAGPSLVEGGSPVVTALIYPDRRVQYEAALVLAAANPVSSFAGADRVVPTLASAIRFADERYALVLASSDEQYQGVRSTLEQEGYSVLPFGRTLNDVASPISEAPGIDLVIVAGSSASQDTTIGEVRGDPRLSAAPVLGLTEPAGVFDLRRRFSDDPSVEFRPEGITPAAMRTAINDLILAATGGDLDSAQTKTYSERALGALRDLAVAQNQVLSVEDASRSLILSLSETTGSDQASVADVLSLFAEPAAQRGIVEAALDASGSDRVTLLGSAAASGRRFGNLLEDRHAAALIDLARTGSDAEATAAASVIGALGLPGADLTGLIAGEG